MSPPEPPPGHNIQHAYIHGAQSSSILYYMLNPYVLYVNPIYDLDLNTYYMLNPYVIIIVHGAQILEYR